MTEKTTLFDLSVVKKENIKTTLKEVMQDLTIKGYQAKNQVIGYLMSGDASYISSFQNARDKILELDRAEILEYLVEESLK
ncbi:MAG: IreB family regulatory phosphoprotein [Bacilli bacterium]|nr:IreB family regulatory phosphoprotein [Bacilli bacterium]